MTPEDILIQISACNRGPEAATLHVLPTLWFRNTWSGSPGAVKAGSGSRSQAIAAIARWRLQHIRGSATVYLYCEGDVPSVVYGERDEQQAALRHAE